MKLSALMFIFIAFAIVKSLIIEDIEDTSIEFPEFPEFNVTASFDFVGVDEEESGIVAALKNIGIAIGGVAMIIWDLLVFIFSVLVYVIELLVFVVSATFTTIPGAPAIVNTLVLGIPTFMIGLIGYKLIRSGSDEA